MCYKVTIVSAIICEIKIFVFLTPRFGWNPSDVMTPLRMVYAEKALHKELLLTIRPDADQQPVGEDIGDGDSFSG